MKIEQAQQISKLLIKRDELSNLVFNLNANNYLEISYQNIDKTKMCKLILLKQDELFKIILEHYKQKLAEYDQEIENL